MNRGCDGAKLQPWEGLAEGPWRERKGGECSWERMRSEMVVDGGGGRQTPD